MKKITLIIGTIALVISTISNAQSSTEYMDRGLPYAKLKGGGIVVAELDELCFQLAVDSQTEYTRAVEAEFIGFASGRNGDHFRKLACNIKWLYGTREYHGGPLTWKPQPPDGSFSPSSPWGPVECFEGGLYSQLPSQLSIDRCYIKTVN